MRKHFFDKRIVLGVAVALTATSGLSMLTTSLSSENSVLISSFFGNSDFSLTAKASEPVEYTLTADDVEVTGDTITKFTPAFKTTLEQKITEAGNDSKDLLIKFPEQINDTNITKIGDEAFATAIPDQSGFDFDSVFHALNLPQKVKISIKLSDNITSIGKAAFAGSERINHVDFGNSIKTIGDKAFAECKISGELVIPNTLEAETGIGEYSFFDNEITKLTVPSNIAKIPSGAFGKNETLTQVVFNEGLKVIDDEAFFRCAISEPFKLPDTLTELGFNAFNSNKIKKVNLPNALTRIGKQAFMDNEIEEIDWGTYENVTNPAPQLGGKVIPLRLFDNNKLKTLNLPTNVSVIGDFAFNTNELKELTIPANIKQIGKNAFYNNTMLHKVKFLTNANGGISKIDESAFAITGIGDHLALPAGIQELGLCAFRKSKIRSVSLEINSADDFPKGTELYQYKDNAMFTENIGWYEGTDLVALYLCQTGSNGTKFITDNKLDDILDDDNYGSNYVINPVLLQFDLNKTGTDLKPNRVEVVRKKNGVEQTATTVQNVEALDYKNYKLGDKIIFTLAGAIPEGYELALSDVTSLGNNRYEVSLDNDNVQNVSYTDDNSDFGYKKVVISLRQKAISPVVPLPETTTPESPSPASTPETASGAITPVDVSSDTTPAGNTTSDTVVDNEQSTPSDTDIKDDITPQGNTKIDKKVTADNTPEVAVDDTKSPLGTLPRTGGSNESVFVILGAALIGLGVTLRKKFR